MAVFDNRGNLTKEAASALNRLLSGLGADPAMTAQLKDAGLVMWNDQPTFMAERMLAEPGMRSNLPPSGGFIPDQTPRQAARLDPRVQEQIRKQISAEAKGTLGQSLTGMGTRTGFGTAVDQNFPGYPSDPDLDGTFNPTNAGGQRPITLRGTGETPPADFLRRQNALGDLVDQRMAGSQVYSAGPARVVPPTARLRGGDPVGPLGSLLPEGVPLEPRVVEYGAAAPQNIYARTGQPRALPNTGTFDVASTPPPRPFGIPDGPTSPYPAPSTQPVPAVASPRAGAPGLRTSYPTSIGAQLTLGGRPTSAIDDMTLARTYDMEGPAARVIPRTVADLPDGLDADLGSPFPRYESRPGLRTGQLPSTGMADRLSLTGRGAALDEMPFGRASRVGAPGLGVRPTLGSQLSLSGRGPIDDMTLARAYDLEGPAARSIPQSTPGAFIPDEVIPPNGFPLPQTGNVGGGGRIPGGGFPTPAPAGGGGGVPPSLYNWADDAAGGLAQASKGLGARLAPKGYLGLKSIGAGALKGLGVAGLGGMGLSMAGGALNTPGEVDEEGLDKADFGQFLSGAGTATSLGGPIAGALIGAGLSNPIGWGLLGTAAIGAGLLAAFKGKDDPMDKITKAADIAGLNPKDYQQEYDFLKSMGAGDEEALNGVRQILMSDRQTADMVEQERLMQPTAQEELALQRFYADELQKITDWEMSQVNALASQYDQYASENPQMAQAYRLQGATTRANAARNAAAAQYQALTYPMSEYLGYRDQTKQAAVSAEQELMQQLIMQRLGYGQQSSAPSYSIADLMPQMAG